MELLVVLAACWTEVDPPRKYVCGRPLLCGARPTRSGLRKGQDSLRVGSASALASRSSNEIPRLFHVPTIIAKRNYDLIEKTNVFNYHVTFSEGLIPSDMVQNDSRVTFSVHDNNRDSQPLFKKSTFHSLCVNLCDWTF